MKIHVTGKNVNISKFKFKRTVIKFTGQMDSCNMLLHITACTYRHLAHTHSTKYYIHLKIRIFILANHVNNGVTIRMCTQFNVFCINIFLENEDRERLSCI